MSPVSIVTIHIHIYTCVFMIYLSTLTEQHPGVKNVLSFDQVSVATSYWPFKKRPDGRGRCKLNKFQRTAIDLACSSDFVMIQGPPGRPEPCQHQLHIILMHLYAGTGKSVTGAHIAYALAMKLREELQKRQGRKDRKEKTPCVMYCGPSQQSVSVVLGTCCSVCAATADLYISWFQKCFTNFCHLPTVQT